MASNRPVNDIGLDDRDANRDNRGNFPPQGIDRNNDINDRERSSTQ